MRSLVRIGVGAVVVAVAIVLASIAGIVDSGGGAFSSWLAEVRGDDPDRGWSRLDEWTRLSGYDNEVGRYLEDVEAADWSALELAEPTRIWFDDGFARVEARLVSPPESVPRFLLERRIVHGVCDGGVPVAIGVYEDRRLVIGGGFGGGGVTGSQARCHASFRGP